MGLLDDAIREHLDLKRRRGADPAEIEKAERDALGPVRRDGSATAVSEPPAAPASVLATAPDAPPEDFVFEDDEHPTTVTQSEAPELPIGESDGHFDDFTVSEIPAPRDELDPPTGQSIAAMPPEPEHKPKRRHLFHLRSHDREPEDDFGAGTPLPAELPADDPFAEEFDELSPDALSAPRETGGGEAVGPAQPIQRDSEPPVQRQPPPLMLTPDAELGHTVEYDVEKAFAEEDQAGDDILEETPDFLADTPDHDRLWFEQKPPPDFDFDA